MLQTEKFTRNNLCKNYYAPDKFFKISAISKFRFFQFVLYVWHLSPYCTALHAISQTILDLPAGVLLVILQTFPVKRRGNAWLRLTTVGTCSKRMLKRSFPPPFYLKQPAGPKNKYGITDERKIVLEIPFSYIKQHVHRSGKHEGGLCKQHAVGVTTMRQLRSMRLQKW